MTPKATGTHRFRNTPKPLALRGLLLLGCLVAILNAPFASTSLARQEAATKAFTFPLDFKNVSPGLEHAQGSYGVVSQDESTGPWFINALRIDPHLATIKIVRALDAGVGLETVTSLASRHGAIAAINGGYFRTTGTYRGENHGLLLLDGKLISEPYNNRADVGLITNGNKLEVLFGHLAYESEISVGTNKRTVQGVNRPVGADELIVFTPEFHRTTLTKPDGIEVLVRNNRVVSVTDLKGSSQIPPDGFVISAVGASREWVKRNLRRGSRVRLRWNLRSLRSEDAPKWPKAQNILGGGPQLIKAGKIDITDKQEKMVAGFATDRHPRTALAVLASGKLLLLTVDGRQPGVSVGMSLQTLAELFLELGAVEAMNLDGGGSTTMVLENKIVNRPSDQAGERPVSDAILVFPRK